MDNYTPTARTKVRRLPKRASYDKQAVHAILDEGFICHIGFALDSQPYVIPTIYARAEQTLYVHGSAASRTLRTLTQGVPVCITVTLLDGLVLARSAFHHSLNYRSVVVIGSAHLVSDPEEKLRALHLITNHVAPRRWEEVRAPNALELKQSSVLALPLQQVSAKIRRGPPVDDEADYSLPVWAGVVPVGMHLGTPLDDGRVPAEAPQIDLARFSRFAPQVPRP
jgi:nitroimidazol reductase NimA-like FMN-containing flavoprotein (pyridoxamine 5'-phosphate oxidase superfamily)